MRISLREFLGKYFTIDELKDSLDDIGEVLSGTKDELVERLAIKWLQYRNVYDLLDFLDEEKLIAICYHFDIQYSSDSHNALKSRIRKSGLLEPAKSHNIDNVKKNSEKTKFANGTKINKKSKLAGIIIVSISLSIIFGILINFAYVGHFDPQYPNVIPLEKEYFLAYSILSEPKVLKVNETLTGKGAIGNYDVSGKLIFTASSLSVQNPIDVRVELFPTRNDDNEWWNYLPENHFAYFPGAKWANDNSREAEIANPVIINLTKSNNPPLISGAGTIIYQKDGTYHFFILDPIELPKIADQFKREISLEYKIPKELEFYNVTKNNDIENQIVIQTADSLNQINANRLTLIAIFVTIIVSVPPGLFYLYKKSST